MTSIIRKRICLMIAPGFKNGMRIARNSLRAFHLAYAAILG